MKSRTQERYENDPRFHACVDSMRAMLEDSAIDIGSLMEAAVHAANLWSIHNANCVFVVRRETLR